MKQILSILFLFCSLTAMGQGPRTSIFGANRSMDTTKTGAQLVLTAYKNSNANLVLTIDESGHVQFTDKSSATVDSALFVTITKLNTEVNNLTAYIDSLHAAHLDDLADSAAAIRAELLQLTTTVLNLYNQANTLRDSVKRNIDSINALRLSITANANAIATNGANITTNTNNITAALNQINSLRDTAAILFDSLAAHNTRILALVDQVNTNTQAIADHGDTLTVHAGRLAQTEADIADHETRLTQAEQDIDDNTAAIATKQDALGYTPVDIADSNTVYITPTKHSADSATLAERFEDTAAAHEGRIAQAEQDIDDNTAAIATKQDALGYTPVDIADSNLVYITPTKHSADSAAIAAVVIDSSDARSQEMQDSALSIRNYVLNNYHKQGGSTFGATNVFGSADDNDVWIRRNGITYLSLQDGYVLMIGNSHTPSGDANDTLQFNGKTNARGQWNIRSSSEDALYVTNISKSTGAHFGVGNGSGISNGFPFLSFGPSDLNTNLKLIYTGSYTLLGQNVNTLQFQQSSPSNYFTFISGFLNGASSGSAFRFTTNQYVAGSFLTSTTSPVYIFDLMFRHPNSKWAPSSGLAEYATLALRQVFATSGTYSGKTFSLLIDPDVTIAPPDYSAIRIRPNVGFAIYSEGSGAKVYFPGNLILGPDQTNYGQKLQLDGTMRATLNNYSNNPFQFIVRDTTNSRIEKMTIDTVIKKLGIDQKASIGTTVNTQSGTSYTLQASDNGKIVEFTNSAAVTVTLPSGLGTTFMCVIRQNGTGDVSITASGTTINNADGYTSTRAQWSQFAVAPTGTTNVFVTQGDMN